MQGRRLGFKPGLDYLDRCLPLKGRPARERMKESRAKTVDIRTRIGGLSPQLLGRNVIGRSPDSFRCALAGKTCYAEVNKLPVHLLVKQDVLRLDVTVHKADLIGFVQSFGDIQADLYNHALIQALSRLDQLVETPPVDQLHDDVRLSLLFTEGVDLGNMRMIQLCRSLRLALERLDKFPVVAERGKHDLDRHLAAERLVHRTIDPAHAPCADNIEQ